MDFKGLEVAVPTSVFNEFKQFQRFDPGFLNVSSSVLHPGIRTDMHHLLHQLWRERELTVIIVTY